MAPITRSVSKDILKYLISSMLDSPNSIKFADGFARLGIHELEDFTSMDPNDIMQLKFSKTEDYITTLYDPSPGDYRKVDILLKWITMKKLESDEPYTAEDWMNLQPDEFNAFRTASINPFDNFIARVKPRGSSVDSSLSLRNKR